MHDSSKVLLGNTLSSSKTVDNVAGDPATLKAGLCVHQKSDGTVTLAASDGSKLGISLGKSASDTKRTAVCRKGLLVPLRQTAAFTPTVGAQVQISTTTGCAVTSGTAVNAVYRSVGLTGIEEDGTTATESICLIDFPGGL